jgi:large conductance mechanosensitive channel protein
LAVVGLAGNVDFGTAMFLLKDNGDPDKNIYLRYGSFVTVLVNFLILAFVLFLVVKAYNSAKKRFEAEKPAAAPAGPTKDQQLLSDILAELKKR